MHRLTVALLAAVDAAIAVAVGIAVTLAPLTLLWVFSLGGGADWNALWPASVTLWQFGNLVPLAVTLPADYIAAAGIDPAAASFTLSLAPLAFAAFTAIFAARSGVRASHADAWSTGVAVGTLVFAALATGAALTARNAVAGVELWQAILVPTLVFALPSLVAAVVTEWREGDIGVVARVRDRVEGAGGGWGEVPALVAHGGAVVIVGLIGLGALLAAAALFARGGEVVALFQAGNVDGLGATVLTVAQLVYLPTLIVWGVAFAAGPGVTLGEGGVISPAGTQVGVVPGIPMLGALPESTSPWMLLLALIPVGLGALAGWITRSRFAGAHDPVAPRLAVTVGIAVLSGAGAALLSSVASGSLGPGRLAFVGPEAGPVALAVGLEVVVGAAILLLSPRSRTGVEEPSSDTWEVTDAYSVTDAFGASAAFGPDPAERNPETDASAAVAPTVDLGPRKSRSDAPLD